MDEQSWEKVVLLDEGGFYAAEFAGRTLDLEEDMASETVSM